MTKKINTAPVISKAKSMVDQYFRITKTTSSKVYFEVTQFKGVYNVSMNKAPVWFQTFQKQYTSDMSTVKSDISSLKTDVSILKTDVSILKTDVSILKTDVIKINERLDSLETRVTTLESK